MMEGGRGGEADVLCASGNQTSSDQSLFIFLLFFFILSIFFFFGLGAKVKCLMNNNSNDSLLF